MDLNNVKLFVMCAKHLNFSRVAELTYMSQPSVSKAIAAFEAEIGKNLFIRNGRKIALTAFGEALLPHAEELLQKEDMFNDFICQYDSGHLVRSITIGISEDMIDSPAEKLLIPLTRAADRFYERHPKVELSVRYYDIKHLRELVSTHRVDIAVMIIGNNASSEQMDESFHAVRMDQQEGYLLYSPKIEPCETLESLAKRLECLLTTSRPISLSATYDFLHHFQFPLRVVRCNSWSEIIIKAKYMCGATILGTERVRYALECGMRIFPLEGITSGFSTLAFWRRDADEVILDFGKLLEDSFSEQEKLQGIKLAKLMNMQRKTK